MIIDIQNDFCQGGTLAVPEGDKVIPAVNRYIKLFSRQGLPIFISRDWHPKKTGHFKQFGGPWPVHCVQGSRGARFHPKLKLPKGAIILSKGMGGEKNSYSDFQSVNSGEVGFKKLLQEMGVEELYIGGLATDYCVKYTVLDALKFGFKVRLLIDAVRGVNLRPGDSRQAIKKMLKCGAKIKDSSTSTK